MLVLGVVLVGDTCCFLHLWAAFPGTYAHLSFRFTILSPQTPPALPWGSFRWLAGGMAAKHKLEEAFRKCSLCLLAWACTKVLLCRAVYGAAATARSQTRPGRF